MKLDVKYIRKWLGDFAPLIDEHDVLGYFEMALKKARMRLAGLKGKK